MVSLKSTLLWRLKTSQPSRCSTQRSTVTATTWRCIWQSPVFKVFLIWIHHNFPENKQCHVCPISQTTHTNIIQNFAIQYIFYIYIFMKMCYPNYLLCIHYSFNTFSMQKCSLYKFLIYHILCVKCVIQHIFYMKICYPEHFLDINFSYNTFSVWNVLSIHF